MNDDLKIGDVYVYHNGRAHVIDVEERIDIVREALRNNKLKYIYPAAAQLKVNNSPKNGHIPVGDSPTKPSHYHEGGIDVFAYMKANFTKEEQRGFHKGTAIKYISRAGKKKGNSYEQDMAKAKVHIEELERLGEEGC